MSIADKLTTIAENEQKVYEKGRTDENREFWKKLIGDGVGACSFSGSTWNDDTFKPTQDIVFTINNGNWLFSLNNITSVKASLAIHGVKFDTSRLNGLSYGFYNIKSIDLPELDLRGLKNRNTTQISNGLCTNTNLVTIDKIILPETWGTITNHNGFLQNNKSLQNVTFEGVIPCSLNVSASPLTAESVLSIITHLADYAGTSNAGAYTLTLSDTSKTAMANLGTIPELNNKTYTEYLASIGWVLG